MDPGEVTAIDETLVRGYHICSQAKEGSICDEWRNKASFDHYCSVKNGNLCGVSDTEVK